MVRSLVAVFVDVYQAEGSGQHAKSQATLLSAHARHITHSCHKQEFPLKVSEYRQGLLNLLFEAERYYETVMFN